MTSPGVGTVTLASKLYQGMQRVVGCVLPEPEWLRIHVLASKPCNDIWMLVHICMCIAIGFVFFTAALLDAKAHSERAAPITYPGRSRLAGYGRVPCPTLLWRESMVLQFSVQACTSVTMSHATPMVEPWPAYFSK